MTIEEAENLAYDHFSRRGWTEGELRTTLGKNEISLMQDIRDLVHKSHIEGSKVGPNAIFQLRENHPRLSQTASWPAPPDGETVRAGLRAALEQNRDPVMRARQAVVDEIMYLSDANMSEVNELLIFLSDEVGKAFSVTLAVGHEQHDHSDNYFL